MADEKLNTGPAENTSPEAAEPITTPEQAVASEPRQEHTGPTIPEPGDVVVSFDKINELMAEKRQNARAEVEKAETPETPEAAVFAYLGDGAAYSIGMAETIHAALRNDNICVFVVNNSVFGMTGGQMAPTTLPHQKTATSPKGKDPAKYGTLNVVDVLGKMDIAYLARGELVGPAGMNNCKKLIRKAFEHQLNGDGFSLVELLSPCPTNLNMPPVKAREHVHTEMTKYFPIGEYIDKKGGNQA